MAAYKDPSDDEIRALLQSAKTIAMVGASADPARPSHEVMRFLQKHGYRVIPVNPGLAGQDLLGEKVYTALADVPGPIDMVDIFRNTEAAGAVVVDVLAHPQLGVKIIWMQLGIVNEAAAERALGAGLKVVMNRCPKIELSRAP
ncbi:MAG TPA: CoA-binding protein [Alphaproteobacteria bacterium]|nr:CoA-binding protein [Alphaproteobacteria bacterium]